MVWKVRISGNDHDLEILADSFDSDLEIIQEGDHYYLKYSDFDHFDESSQVREKAEELMGLIFGLSRIEGALVSRPEVNHVYEESNDGSDHISVSNTETMGVNDSVSISVSDEDGTREVYSTGDKAAEFTELALQDGAVAEVATLLNKGNDWVNLYRIFEVVQDDAEGVVDKGWVTESEKGVFKQTANSKEVLGDEARHGDQRVPAPKDPMTHEEAKSLIYELIEEWIDSK